MPDSEMQSKEVTVSEEAIGSLTGQAGEPEGDPEGLEILFQPDPSIWDGRFANNAWLQELPKPLTKLTWDNAALISPGTAEKLGLSNEELVELQIKEFKVPAPVWILPGQPADTVAVHLGYGRAGTGSVLEGAGFNANRIRTSEAFWFGSGLKIQKLGEHYPLATTQHHHSMEGRHLVRAANLEEFIQNPELFREEEPEADELPSIYPEFEYDGDSWGMSINLNACIGCNACVIACQAENNIPTVGKEQVQNAREMHWLRVDRYFKGDLDNPEVYFQPVPCMHCERAPCEPVCPVEATLHNSEGLNEMIYNRCVGTRYCSNNCPYKVRRFNFFEYVDDETIPLKMARNPEVTVRSRGVMEKCTYCIQRINNTRNRAEVEERPIKDGEIKTACQQACPTNAIVFGNINDETSQVSASKNQPHDYSLLAELNTKPRTTYLAKLRNPNPRLENRG
jgi:molybdopterin-containing oxidoreductase family iron-sulfur binding subunit